jgi:glycosyltransferase involved in cell wall biosynthesis
MQCCDVSVIIPTYNRLSFLQEAVASVVEQDPAPRELIIIDDGSTDETWDWLTKIASESIRVFRQAHQGPAAARNLGVSQARSRFVAFLDSDDLWLQGKLKVQVHFLNENPSFKICQTEEIWMRRGVRVNPHQKHQKPSGYIFEHCLKLCLISPSAVMIEKDFLLRLGGFDPSLPVCEDYELWLRASLQTQVQTLPHLFTVKRGGHADQLSTKYWGMDRFRVQAMEKILINEPLTEEQKGALLAELKNKLTVLANGHQKRHPELDNPYQEKLLWLQKNHFDATTDVLPLS